MLLLGPRKAGVSVRLKDPDERGEIDIGGTEGSVPKLVLSSNEKRLFRSEGPKYWASELSCCISYCTMNELGPELERPWAYTED